MKIEVFSDELNSRIRGAKLNGERVKEKLRDMLNNLMISQASGGSGGFIDNDVKTLIMMFQIVWNEKEELAEKSKQLEMELPTFGLNDHVSIGGSSLCT